MSDSQPLSKSAHVIDRDSLDYYVRSAVAGGFAGGLAKTAVAPIERVKILFQTHHAEYTKYAGSFRGAGLALREILRTQGARGLYRGHSLTLARAVPHAALGYTVYEKARSWLMPTPETQTPFRRTLTGAIAGLSALPFTYPFELIRVRMAIDNRTAAAPRATPWAAMRGIWSEGLGGPLTPQRPITVAFPVLHFYRGFAVSVLGTVPYRGGIFLVWETLNAYIARKVEPSTLAAHRGAIHLAVGAAAGTTAQIVTYPLEVIRRMQQASGLREPTRAVGLWETVRTIALTRGWRGFYVGLGIGLVKQVPMNSISLATWQAAKTVLHID